MICVCLNMRYSPNHPKSTGQSNSPNIKKTPPFPGSQDVKIPVGMVIFAMALASQFPSGMCVQVVISVISLRDFARGIQRVYLHFSCLNTKFLLNFASLDGHFRMFLIIVSNVDGELPALMAKSVKSC